MLLTFRMLCWIPLVVTTLRQFHFVPSCTRSSHFASTLKDPDGETNCRFRITLGWHQNTLSVDIMHCFEIIEPNEFTAHQAGKFQHAENFVNCSAYVNVFLCTLGISSNQFGPRSETQTSAWYEPLLDLAYFPILYLSMTVANQSE